MKLVRAEGALNSRHPRWRGIEIKTCMQILKIEGRTFLIRIKGEASPEWRYVDGAHDVEIC